MKQNRVDYRAKRLATHFRNFFRCFDKDGHLTDNTDEIVTIELTQRANDYYANYQKQSAPVPAAGHAAWSNIQAAPR